MEKKLMFVDAETDGLYGATLSIAALVIDEKGNEVAKFYERLVIQKEELKDEWAKEHVYPILGDAKMWESEKELLESFWNFYIHYQKCEIIADVPYPVETNVFYKCVMADEAGRRFLAPYPLMDLCSMLYAKGMDPKVDRQSLLEHECQVHNAMSDVRMSAEIWKRYIED